MAEYNKDDGLNGVNQKEKILSEEMVGDAKHMCVSGQ